MGVATLSISKMLGMVRSTGQLSANR